MINVEAFFSSADVDKDERVTLEELERLAPPLRGMNEVGIRCFHDDAGSAVSVRPSHSPTESEG